MRNSKRVFAFLLAVSIVLALPVAVSAAGGIPGEQQGGSLDITGGGTVVIPPTTGNNSYVITVEAGPGGTVDPVGTVQVAKGADKTIAVESLDCGYGIVDVLVDGKSVGAVKSYTFENVQSSHTISFSFGIISTLENFTEIYDETRYSGFADVDENQWYGANKNGVIETVVNLGLMSGYPDGTFNPTGNITLAEAITMASILHDIYIGNNGEMTQYAPVWYQVYVDYAIDHAIIKADDFADYTRYATRAEMVYIFSNALPADAAHHADPLEKINTISSIPDVARQDQYGDEIYRLYEAGVLGGNDELGTFAPDRNIIRAEAASIIIRLARTVDRLQLAL
jgi:hypothetical protein